MKTIEEERAIYKKAQEKYNKATIAYVEAGIAYRKALRKEKEKQALKPV